MKSLYVGTYRGLIPRLYNETALVRPVMGDPSTVLAQFTDKRHRAGHGWHRFPLRCFHKLSGLQRTVPPA